jgi:hypothetical protein
MRSRQDIEYDNRHRIIPFMPINELKEIQIENQKLIIEVLLDIRDILLKGKV